MEIRTKWEVRERKIKELTLNKKINPKYRGYLLLSYAESLLSIQQVKELYTKLERVPAKISTFFNRETIKTVYKFNASHYFIIDQANNVYIADY